MSTWSHCAPLIAAVGCLFAGASVSAAPVTVPNASFEDAGPGFWTADNWELVDDSTSTTLAFNVNVKDSGATGVAGDHYAAVYVDHNAGGTQDVPAEGSLLALRSASLGTFTADTVYTLTALLGSSDNANAQIWVGLGLGAGALGIDDLTADNHALYEATSFAASSALEQRQLVLDTADVPDLVGQEIYVSLLTRSTYNFGREGLFDGVTLDAVVPEPGALALLGLGGVALLRRRQRRHS